MLFEAVVALPGVQVAVVYTDVELILLAHLFDVALGTAPDERSIPQK